MTDQSGSAFDSNPQETPANSVPNSNDVFADQLKQITNESGEQKYDSTEKALEALKHSQEYIPQLKTELDKQAQELATLREEITKRESVEEVVSRLSAKQEPEQSDPQPSGLDEQAVLNIVQNFNSENKQQEVAQANVSKVSQAMFQKYGDKTQEVVAQKAQQLNISVDDLKQLAQKSPDAVMTLFEVQAAASVTPSTSSISIPPNTPPDEGLKPPAKSLLYGASMKDQVAYMNEVKRDIYKKYNVEE